MDMDSPVIDQVKLERSLEALLDRVDKTLTATEQAFPYFADPETGEWETTPDGNWCGGHWVGLLWIAAEHAEDEANANRYKAAALNHTETLHEYIPHGTMFCGMNFHYAGFRAYDVTGDRSLFGIGLEGADAMVDLYHEGARQIPLGSLAIKGPEQFRGPDNDQGPSGDRLGAVDNIYTTLPVLWRAYEETGDQRFRDVAISHADRHLDWNMRGDGSTWHHSVFNSESGALERQYNELAQSDDSCWARGLGWNVAGLARAYRETGSEQYLDALHRSIKFHRQNSPDDGVPYWDYAIDGDEPRDTSTAALIAYGLARLPNETKTSELHEYGHEVLETLLSSYLVTDSDAENRGAVLHGCFNRPGEYADDNELIWTNYYVTVTVYDLLDGA